MTPGDFIRKWRGAELTERAAAQSHFSRVLGEPAPTDADPRGEWYAFEKGALKTGGGDGWADVWKRRVGEVILNASAHRIKGGVLSISSGRQ
jgi:hypothetical protein